MRSKIPKGMVDAPFLDQDWIFFWKIFISQTQIIRVSRKVAKWDLMGHDVQKIELDDPVSPLEVNSYES